MRGSLLFLVTFGAVSASADEPECKRYAERAGPDLIQKCHTAARAGIDRCVNRLQPSVKPSNILGYVNCTTFGMDNSLFGRRPGRLFPGLWPDGRKPNSYSERYVTDGPIKVTDIVALQPVRKAIIEARVEKYKPHEEAEAHEKHDDKHSEKHDEKHDEHKPDSKPPHNETPAGKPHGPKE